MDKTLDELLKRLDEAAPWALEVATRAAVWTGLLMTIGGGILLLCGLAGFRIARRNWHAHKDEPKYERWGMLEYADIMVPGLGGTIVTVVGSPLLLCGLHKLCNPEYAALMSLLP